MRSLVILRGSQGSGKSTWVRQNQLEEYTLCADTLRMLVESPVLVADSAHRVISQKNDNYVWELLYELLEKRMQRGEFVIIDATHSRQSDFSRYNKLCERYRYRKYYVDFSDVSIEECKVRNLMREEYRRVPDKVIDKIYARLKTQGKTSGYKEISKDNFREEIGVKLFNFDSYKRINIFGDIHGCYEPLAEFFEKFPYSEEEFYIFCGDYVDRGIQNKETLEFLINLSRNSNVLLLEGNHECWIKHYANDEVENIKSHSFIKHTVPQIIDMNRSDLREFYRRIGQLAYFEFDGQKYLVTHGGLPYMPEELQFIATEQLIHGVGDYNTNIDEVFAKNYSGVIQVHGHRNTYELENFDEKSYNLEDKIEFGGNLRILQLVAGEKPQMVKIKNNVFSVHEEEEDDNLLVEEKKKLSDIIYLEKLRDERDIREKDLGNGISSFNFTRDAFYSKNWNEYTCKARGLFVDSATGKVVARGYEKFFNVNERRETELEHLLVKFKDKHITCYKKENGFLGILSYVKGELFFASKSTNSGDFADMFRHLYEKSSANKEAVVEYLKNNDVTLVFEVIDQERDPHIIEYPESKIVLLDVIKNDYEFERMPYSELKDLAAKLGLECKTIYKEFDNVREFHSWYLASTDEDDMSKSDIEGVVIECDGIMTKLKFPYYNFWKFMRAIKEKVKLGRTVQLSSLYNAESNYFYAWLKGLDSATLEKDIISLRNMFEEGTKDNENE